MKTTMLFRRFASWQLAAVLTLAGAAAHAAHPTIFASANNDSDIVGVANVTDTRLVNPWGLCTGTEGNLHVANEGTGLSTLYGPFGADLSATNPITIPPAPVSGTLPGVPTGIDTNYNAILEASATNDFVITSGTVFAPAHYLYCTEDGAIEGYRAEVDKTSAVIAKIVPGAGYTGIALSWVSGSGGALSHQLYAANFGQGRIDVFDHEFNSIGLTGTINFTDPTPPAVTGTGLTWSPFNIHRVDYKKGKNTVRLLLVVYAEHTAAQPLNDVPGAGNGYAALYLPDGQFVSQLKFGSDLNSPWGIAVAHGGLGKLAAPIVIFVGNHGDGLIHAYAIDPAFPDLNKELGVLNTGFGVPLAFDGLWTLHFGTTHITAAQYAADPADLQEIKSDFYFSAGILNESHGLVGRIFIP